MVFMVEHAKMAVYFAAKFIFKQAHIIGSTMGSPTEFEAMLQFVEQRTLRLSLIPVIHFKTRILRSRDSKSQLVKSRFKSTVNRDF